MKPAQLIAGLESLDNLTGIEAVCCFVTEEERPLSGATGFLDWRLCGALSRVLVSGFFVGANLEQLLLPTEGRIPASKVFAVGLGPSKALNPPEFERAIVRAASMLSRAKIDSVALCFGSLPAQIAPLCDELIERSFAPHFSGAVAVFVS